ncbi:hypothetical protein VTK56DRAFT_779 [Thermocarpiscus australiensis]
MSTGSASASEEVETIPSSTIRVFRTVESVRRWRHPHLFRHKSVALVPTMGALHEGHLSLIRAAARKNDHVVVSIFVNPAQFGEDEDLHTYPVTWGADAAALARLDAELAEDHRNCGRISAVFKPSPEVMYPEGYPGQAVTSKGSFVTITPLGELLEGERRPTFFRGVATVCMKLFNIVQPDRVYFGQKDVQQTVLIRRLVRDFMLPIEVVVRPTIRAPDGLALSSRNVYLGTRRRQVANMLYRGLKASLHAYRAGARDREAVLQAAHDFFDRGQELQLQRPANERVSFEVDYISLADPDTMEEVEEVDPFKGAILSGALYFFPVDLPQEGEDLGASGGPLVRLIDNIILRPDVFDRVIVGSKQE